MNCNNAKMIDRISVIMSTYDDPINFVSQCLKSLLMQEKISDIVVIDSSKKDKIKTFCQSLNNNKVNYVYTPPRGLSDARNKGLKIAKNNIVAFTDSDCIVDQDWSENICKSFNESYQKNTRVAIVGGKILPIWKSRPNNILLNSAIAQGFYSLFDMGEDVKDVEQIFGANFAINKNMILEFGIEEDHSDQLFLSELGRKKSNLLGGEECYLCKKVRDKRLKILYNPSAIVWHQIPNERSRIRWMWRRIYYGGITRALLKGKPTPKTVDFISYNINDIIFLMIFMVPYIYGYVYGSVQKIR